MNYVQSNIIKLYVDSSLKIMQIHGIHSFFMIILFLHFVFARSVILQHMTLTRCATGSRLVAGFSVVFIINYDQNTTHAIIDLNKGTKDRYLCIKLLMHMALIVHHKINVVYMYTVAHTPPPPNPTRTSVRYRPFILLRTWVYLLLLIGSHNKVCLINPNYL